MADVLKEGQKAPAFSLPASTGKKIALADYLGKQNVVLYFYPRDMTPGCTTEACAFRDNWAALDGAEAVVLGVSTDNVDSHGKFIAKYELPFPLLADEDHALAEKFGVWAEKNMYGRKSMGVVRSTFVIDKAGVVRKVWPKVKVDGHAQEVLAFLQEGLK